MGFGLLIALVAVVAVGGAAVSYRMRQKRRDELALMALQLGLEYSPADLLGCLGLPFGLLQKGDGRGTENVLSGTWREMPLREFDYWYYEESTDSKGNRTRTYYRFSCAVTEIDLAMPGLAIYRESAITWVANHLALHDIEFESEEFNRRFNVKGSDRKFANDLLDERMIQWLLTVEGAFAFEVAGCWILCFSKKRRPIELIPLLGTLQRFRDQVPRVVYELYGETVPPPPVPLA
jgi:hypothetical protein